LKNWPCEMDCAHILTHTAYYYAFHYLDCSRLVVIKELSVGLPRSVCQLQYNSNGKAWNQLAASPLLFGPRKHGSVQLL
jgi:hypothetical protein